MCQMSRCNYFSSVCILGSEHVSSKGTRNGQNDKGVGKVCRSHVFLLSLSLCLSLCFSPGPLLFHYLCCPSAPACRSPPPGAHAAGSTLPWPAGAASDTHCHLHATALRITLRTHSKVQNSDVLNFNTWNSSLGISISLWPPGED